MTRMRRRAALLVTALLVAGGGSVATAIPAMAEYIRDFEVAVEVRPDTSFTVVETIVYDFENEYRHGIFRDIPVVDETITGQRRQYGISVADVTMDGARVPWTTSDNSPFLNVRIGDPNTTITGAHTYVVTYTVTDGLRVITEEDVADPKMPDTVSAGDVELYWDFVGTGWDVAIQSANASVTGPGNVLSAVCYAGPAGATDTCPAATAASVALLGPASLGPGDALTGAVVYPRTSFTRTPRENVSQGLPSNPLAGVIVGLVPALLLAGIPIGLAIALRREDAGAPVPGAPPQYAPPDGLSPAEMSAAWEGRSATTAPRVLVATLLDLAARRWINVSTDAGDDLAVTWLGTGTSALRPWEESLLSLVLKGQPFATVKGYDSLLAAGWKSTVRELVADQEAVGRRNPRGDEPDRRWTWMALVALALLAVGIVSIFIEQPAVSGLAFTAGIGTLIGFFVARAITPRKQTQQSAQFIAKVEGFRKVLGTDPAAARREFAHRSGLTADAIFATMLPYAVVFELESSWIGAFPDLTDEQLTSHGFMVGSVYAIDSLVSSSTTSISSAMTAPSSGSGGGGSSGGGGGGGGGGSW
jgi:uncharacterized membrane protein YgcG